MQRIGTTRELIRTAEQIFARNGFQGTKVHRDEQKSSGPPILYTTSEGLHGPRAGKAIDEIITTLCVEFIAEGTGWT